MIRICTQLILFNGTRLSCRLVFVACYIYNPISQVSALTDVLKAGYSTKILVAMPTYCFGRLAALQGYVLCGLCASALLSHLSADLRVNIHRIRSFLAPAGLPWL